MGARRDNSHTPLAINRRWSSPSRIALAFQQHFTSHAAEPRPTRHSVIPAPLTFRTRSETAAYSAWLSRAPPRPTPSGVAAAYRKSVWGPGQPGTPTHIRKLCLWKKKKKFIKGAGNLRRLQGGLWGRVFCLTSYGLTGTRGTESEVRSEGPSVGDEGQGRRLCHGALVRSPAGPALGASPGRRRVELRQRFPRHADVAVGHGREQLRGLLLFAVQVVPLQPRVLGLPQPLVLALREGVGGSGREWEGVGGSGGEWEGV